MKEEFIIEKEGSNPILESLLAISREGDYWAKFNLFDSMLNAMESKTVDIDKTKEWLRSECLKNIIFIRKFEMFKKIQENTETGLEFFGKDHITHPEFHFDKDFMEKLTYINLKINDVTGMLIKELSDKKKYTF